MAKTAKQVQGDIYQLLKDSTLYTMISGEVYRQGYRPRDSRKEDAVVIFTAGLPDQIQTGVVTVQIYCPDIDPYGNGVFVEDGQRTEELEALAQRWVESLTAEVSCYKFRLQATISTDYAEDIKQHFVVVPLKYEYFGGDDELLNIPQSAVIVTEDGELPIVQPVVKKMFNQ